MKNEGKKLFNMLVLETLFSSNTIFKHHYNQNITKNKIQKQYISLGTNLLLRRGDY